MCVGLIDDRPGGRTEKAGAEIPVVYGEQGTAYIIPERGMIPHGLKNTLLHKGLQDHLGDISMTEKRLPGLRIRKTAGIHFFAFAEPVVF